MKERSHSLRKNMTTPENRIWYYLRNRRLSGYKFVRQHVIGKYIVDFLCREKKLIIEIDGGQHMNAVIYDKQRTEYLESLGYTIFRVWNHDALNNIQGVMDGILQLMETFPYQNAPSSPALLPQAGEGSEN